MKLPISHSDLDSTPHAFMREAGYFYIVSRHTGQGSYTRPLGNGHYPRFHAYIDEEGEKVTVNLHLDQKQASYEGTAAHSGEYDGPLVSGEIERLRRLIKPGSGRGSRPSSAPLGGGSGDARADRFSSLLRGM